ncbi:hypothetical protein JTB14_030546 [Gonioctena quinquepunctata]|nr:hypothetical protein JTB14_030546 [Gonioctena quinquepunctata]
MNNNKILKHYLARELKSQRYENCFFKGIKLILDDLVYTPEELFEIQATEAEEDSITGKKEGSFKSNPTYLDKVQNIEHHIPAQQSLVLKEIKQVITPKPTYIETKIGRQVENHPRKLRSVSSLLK